MAVDKFIQQVRILKQAAVLTSTNLADYPLNYEASNFELKRKITEVRHPMINLAINRLEN